MKIWYNNILNSKRYVAEVVGTRIRIGRATDNDIVLDNPYVPEEAAVLYRRGPGWEVVALGAGVCKVGERELTGGNRMALEGSEPIAIFPFTLNLDPGETGAVREDDARKRLDEEASEVVRTLHVEILPRIETRGDRAVGENELLNLENMLEDLARARGYLEAGNVALVNQLAGHCVRDKLLDDLLQSRGEPGSALAGAGAGWSRMVTAAPAREQELAELAARISRTVGVSKDEDLTEQMTKLERGFWGAWDGLAPRLFEEFKGYLMLRHLKKQIKDILFGYGPLEDLLRTPTISEIMVVNRDRIYVERRGIVENSGRRFISDEVTQTIIERIVSRVGRRIDKSQPLVDARLTDGSRVNAVIPPLAVSGPCLTIRKFPSHRLLIDDLVRRGSITRTVAEFLRAAVVNRRNILISGGTGTGKTTLLNCLSDFIPDKERIVTIEDTAELQIKKEHVVNLETKQANVEGAGAYSIRDLVKNSLRMRPDRIVVGECRGPEALDMLQAMNTGHDGSLTTIHANAAEDVILRLEVLVQMAADLPLSSIHRQIASAIDLIVQLTRFRDGSRRVSQVTEVTDVDPATGTIRTRDLYRIREGDPGMKLRPTGHLPTFMEELIESNLIQLENFYIQTHS